MNQGRLLACDAMQIDMPLLYLSPFLFESRWWAGSFITQPAPAFVASVRFLLGSRISGLVEAQNFLKICVKMYEKKQQKKNQTNREAEFWRQFKCDTIPVT